jgi:sporulation protein YlmC with PRC-barrel domain
VTVDTDTVIRPPRDGLEQRAEDNDLEIVGKLVLTERGMELGSITDVDFDPETGAVTTLLTKTETIAGQRMIGLGGYAVVVSA